MSYKGFTSVEMRKPERSLFDLSHEVRLSTRMGKLTPIYTAEVMPNDTFYINNEVMLRLAPMLAPIMHRVNVYVHHFFVPNRILASWWEQFITNGRLGTETPPVPSNATIASIGALAQNLLSKGSLADYLGIPPIADGGSAGWTTRTIDLLPFAAYQKIWYDYYRDRNFVADPTFLPMAPGTIGSNLADLLRIRYRCWEHDYFTSSLPWTQRGAAVLLPVIGSSTTINYLPTSRLLTNAGANPAVNTLVGSSNVSNNNLYVNKTTAADAGFQGRVENIDNIQFGNTVTTINDFRRAQRLQMWLERQAVAGSRYNETIYAHFARRTSDARLQRAEYLGGGKVPVQISEVVAPNWSNDGTGNVPAGNMAGHGLSYGHTNKAKFNAEEHGFVMSIMSIMPTSGYMQGIPNMFRRRNTFLDYPWPLLAHLGEQPVYNNEIFMDTTSINVNRANDPIFGYQSRYADWKFEYSRVSGDFRDTLNRWHLTRTFATQPVLGETFNTFEDALQNRIFAVSNVDTCWLYIYNSVKVRRSLPYFGTPML